MTTYIENPNTIVHETSVDFITRPCAREIHIVQYDKSLPVIKVHLYKEGVPYELPSSAAVHVRLGKLDRTFVYANILGTNEDRTIAYFEITEQMAMIPGRISPVIEVVYQGKVACSSPIPFVIERNPVQNGQIESHDEFPIIYQLESDVEEHNEWIAQYTALTKFDGFVEGESVWDDIAEGEMKYCQSGSQTEDVPGENTVIKIDLTQQHLSKSESKALYIKKIVINYTPDGQEEEETYEYTFNSRIFGSGNAEDYIEPLYADLTDENSGTTLRWYLNYLLQEGVSKYFGAYNGTKGQQFGSNSNPPALISLSTSSLENCTVNSIYVEVSSNTGTKAKCKLTIVNDVWTCGDIPDPQITSDNDGYDWFHEPNGTHLGSSSGGQVTHHYNHVFLKKENGIVTEVQPNSALQYVLNDYSNTYKYSDDDNLLHKVGGGASFEVLSKIEVSHDSEEDVTYITFPKNIMPKVMYLEDTNTYLYFDYVNLSVYDGQGNEVQYDDIQCVDGNIVVPLSGYYSISPDYDYMSYDVFDGYDNPLRHTSLQINWYEVYRMQDIYATQDYVDEEIAYALTTVYKPKGSSTVSNLNNISKSAGMSGDIYNMSDGGSLTNQDSSTVDVLSGDNVVFCWNNGSWYWDKMAGSIDLSNYVDLTSNQTITGTKTFSEISFGNTHGYISNMLNNGLEIHGYNIINISISSGPGARALVFDSSSLYVNKDDKVSLGTSSYRYKDLYLSGKGYINDINFTSNLMFTSGSANRAELASGYFRSFTGADLGSSTYPWKDLYLSNGSIYKNANQQNYWREIGDSAGNFILQVSTDNTNYSNVLWVAPNQKVYTKDHIPTSNNTFDLGTSSTTWKDLYLGGSLFLGANTEIKDTGSYFELLYGGNILMYVNNSYIQMNRNFTPATDNQRDLGLITGGRWRNLYLAGNLSDGTNSVTVADIAQKGVDYPQESQPGDPWWIFVLDANGEATMDLEYGSLPDGLYWVTYGNVQAFMYLTQEMITNSYAYPIRIMIPCIYNAQGESHVGTLRLSKDSSSSTILRLKIVDYNGNHVPQGYQVKFYKTKLM